MIKAQPIAGSDQSDAVYKRRVRDSNNRMLLRALNVNLDHYDFPVIFVQTIAFRLPAVIIDFAIDSMILQ